MAATPAYLEFLLEHMAPLGEITMRRMFGGHCFYCDGTVFALLANNVLFLKADEVTRGGFEAIGAEPFRPFEGFSGTMSYYPPPPEFFEDADAMLLWGRAAVEAGRRSEIRKKKPSARPRAAKASKTAKARKAARE
jgi:DNA transformation protein